MSFWFRSALVFLAAAAAANLVLPFALNKVFATMTFAPTGAGPEPTLRNFQPIGQDLRNSTDILPEANGAFRVDFRANLPAGGDAHALTQTIDAIAADHCRVLMASIAQTCRLEAMQSSVRTLSSGEEPTRPSEVFMRFVVTPRKQ